MKSKTTIIEYLSYDLSHATILVKGGHLKELPLVSAWISQKQHTIYGAVGSLSTFENNVDSVIVNNFASKPKESISTIVSGLDHVVELISHSPPKGFVVHVPIYQGQSYSHQVAFCASFAPEALVLVSTNAEQVQKHSLLAYLATLSLGPVVHFYHVDAQDIPETVSDIDLSPLYEILTSPQKHQFQSLSQVREILKNHGIHVPVVQFLGIPSSSMIVSFGSDLPWEINPVLDRKKEQYGLEHQNQLDQDLVEKLKKSNKCLLQVYQLSPWPNTEFLNALPTQLDNIELLLPSSLKWGPQYLQTVQTISNCSKSIQVKVLESSSDLKYDFGAMSLAESAHVEIDQSTCSILRSAFSDKLRIFQSIGSSDVAFGQLLSELQRIHVLKQSLYDISRSDNPESLKSITKQLLESHDSKELGILFGKLESSLQSQDLVHYRHIVADKSLILPQARWMVDQGHLLEMSSSLIHSILSSGENINILIIDRNPYDGSFSDEFKDRRDAGLYALNYGNAYVASICPTYSFAQAIQAIKAAEAFPGPSVVTLLSPKLALKPNGKFNPLDLVSSCKRIIDQGLFSLYRWVPSLDGQEPHLEVDSSKPKATLEKFLEKDSNLALVLEGSATADNEVRHDLEFKTKAQVVKKANESFQSLFGNIEKKKLVILYGSDGGNAASLAKRIGMEAKEKGLFVKVYAGDSFVIEDLVKESYVLFVVSTAGQGEFPGNFRETWKALSASHDFSSVNYSVLALGDRHYWPRPEDSHYFVKAGKDLDERISKLGGKRLTEIGIGDDRDPDGYSTGVSKWAPRFWSSLGVDAEAITTGHAPPTDDAIKAASNYLRGTIAEGLLDTSTGALAEYDTKLTKFHGIYQQDDRDIREFRALKGMEKAFSFMIRVRVPGGVATPTQYLAMDDVSDRWANGTIKITTRQAFQFHGVVKSVLKRSIQDINRSLLDTIAACGDVNRNVMCNPNPNGPTSVHRSVLKLSNDLSAHLTPSTSAYHEIWLDKKLVAGGEDNEPLYGKTYLPRKFKIAVAVPPSNDVDVLAHDLGYIAIVENGVVIGYNVTVGGGMGQTHGNKKTYPVLAKPLGFCTPEQAVLVGEKVMLVQRDYGERVNRKHARLKYTIEDKGLDWFRTEVESRLGYKLSPPKPYKFTSNGDRYGWANASDGTWSYTLFIQNGRIKDTEDYSLKTGLREIAKIHKGSFALTPNQHLVIANISTSEKSLISSLLLKYGIDNNGLSGLRLNSMACVALPTCALAMAESERYLPVLVGKIESLLEANGLRDDAITIRMTGCPNGCARPSIAEIAFIGKAPGMYNMYLGGGFAGERLNQLYRESIDEQDILRLLEPLIKQYSLERINGEHFGDFIMRKNILLQSK